MASLELRMIIMLRNKYDLDDEFWDDYYDDSSGRCSMTICGQTIHFNAKEMSRSEPIMVKIHRGDRELYNIWISPWAMCIDYVKEDKQITFSGDYREWEDFFNN